jgi:hypothetical protein
MATGATAVAELIRLAQAADPPAVVVDGTRLPVADALRVVGEILDAEEEGRFAGQLQVLARAGAVAAPRPALRPAELCVRIDGAVTVWVPVLSEGTGDALAAVHESLRPDDVCPVVPFPARNPRRGDDLLLEHRELLFERIGIDGSALVHAREDDAFDLCHVLSRLADRHATALRGLARSDVVVSPAPSLLCGLGAALAARQAANLRVAAWDRAGAAGDDGELACLWLAGEPYREAAP